MSDSDYMNVKLSDGAAPTQTSNHILCGLCDVNVKQKDATYCVDCCINICTSCLKPHSKFPAAYNHTLTKSSDGATEEYRYCDTHRNVYMKFFCGTCRIPICAECQVLAHLNHMCCKVEEEIENVKVRLEERKAAVEEMINDEKRSRQELHRKLSDFEKVHQQTKQNLDAEKLHMEQEFEQINDKNAKLYGSFQGTMKENIKRSDKRLNELQAKAQDIIQLIADLAIKCKTDSVALQLPNIPAQLPVPSSECPQLVQSITPAKSAVGHPRSNMSVQTCEHCMSEGKIRFRITNINSCEVDEGYFSEDEIIANLPWSIYVYHSFGEVLAVKLLCDRHEELKGQWLVDMDWSTSLLHPTDTSKSLTERESAWFAHDDVDDSIVHFCDWTDLQDEGFIKDKAITVETTVKVKRSSGTPNCTICQ